MMTRRARRGTDWSRATHRMPASFTDQPRRDDPVQGRRDDDGLDVIEAITGTVALAALAELATGDDPVREDAVGVAEEDVDAALEETELDVVDEDRDVEED